MSANQDNLRRKAGELLKLRKKESPTEGHEDFEKLLEDYNINKIKLELQQEELIKSNQLLESQNEKLDDYFEYAPIPYLIINQEGKIEHLNQTACQLLLQSRQALLGQSFTQFIDPDSQDRFYLHWQKLFNTKQPQSVELRIRVKESRKSFFLLNSSLYQEPGSNEWFARISTTDISAVKEADLLRDSERRYRLLFKNMINGLIVLKPVYKNDQLDDFHFFRANAAFEKMTGISARIMEGSPFIHVFPDKGKEILPMLYNTVSHNKNQKIQNFSLTQDTIVNLYSFVPEEDYVAMIIEDVTSKKKAEAERQKSEEMLKTIFKILPVGVTVTDVSGDIIDCNEASEGLLGIKKEEHIIRNVGGKEWRIIRPDLTSMPPKEFASIRALKENSIVENVEMGIVKKKGQVTWINVSAAPIPLPDLGVAIVYSDITERVLAQEETEAKFKNVVQNSTDAIIIVNPYGLIIEWNKGCELIFGINRKNALNKEIWTFLSETLAPGTPLSDNNMFLKENIENALKHGESPWFQQIHETEIIDTKGNRKTLQSVAFPVKSTHGFIMGIVSRDISESKEAEKMLKIAKEKAEEASMAKSTFLANISHEIRTPLNAIMGFTGILKEFKVDNTRFKDHLSGIEKSSKALMSLINDILDLSRFEAGKMEISYVDLNIRNLIEDVRQIFSLKAESKGISLTTKVRKDVPVVIKMDEVRLRQVLFNLLGNAVKFTYKGTITIEVDSADEDTKSGLVDLVIKVTDTGIGIEEEEMDKIFDPFYQKAPLKIMRQEGTGLGLAISRRFVQMLKGEISVSSAPGEGTIFTVTLPGVKVLEWGSDRDKHIAAEKTKREKTEVLRDTSGIKDVSVLAEQIRKEIIQITGSEKKAREFLSEKIWTEYDKVADILGFEEVIRFAGFLDKLAESHKLKFLKRFSEILMTEAGAFNVIEINRMLTSLEKLRS